MMLKDRIPVTTPVFAPDSDLYLEYKKSVNGSYDVYKVVKYPGLIQGEVKIPIRRCK